MNRTIALFFILSTSACCGASVYDNPRTVRFTVSGKNAFVLAPDAPAESHPWVWFAPTFFGSYPSSVHNFLIGKLLENGIAIAGIDVGETCGDLDRESAFDDFYKYMVTQGYSAKARLLPQSRGGLMLYGWAARNAEKIERIAGIYTVGDMNSYPTIDLSNVRCGGMSRDRFVEVRDAINPVDHLASLAAAGVPILHIHGDSDTTVPMSTNSQRVIGEYRAMGGNAELIVVPGKGHEEIVEFFQDARFVEFLTEAAVPAKRPIQRNGNNFRSDR